jgi:hypothetical protein
MTSLSRRTFLKGSLGAAGVLALGSSASCASPSGPGRQVGREGRPRSPTTTSSAISRRSYTLPPVGASLTQVANPHLTADRVSRGVATGACLP